MGSKIKITRDSKASLIAFTLILMAVIGFTLPGSISGQSGNTLVAAKTTDTITVDGSGSEAAWASATAITITTAHGELNTAVTMKALYDANNVYFLLSWADSSRSDLDKAWVYDADGDGGNGSFSYLPNDRTGDGKHSEDRLGLTWEMGTVAGYDTQGCAVLCHTDHGDGGTRMHTAENGTEKADEWHWKAARSNYIGIAHDKYQNGDVEMDHEVEDYIEAGHHGDGGSWYHTNANGSGPKYFEPSATGEDARFITQAEIDSGEAILVDGNEDQLTDGQVVPGRYLDESAATGDVADVKAKGVHDGSGWTLELKRALDTGHADHDVKFAEFGSYRFGLALFDDQGHDPQHAYADGVYVLKVGEEVTPPPGDDDDSPGFTAYLAVAGISLAALVLSRRSRA